jgi:hypothetical protein
MRSFIRTIFILLVLIVLGGAVFIGSGLYNVAANAPHWKLTYMILKAAKERSVSVHSAGINIPSLKGQRLEDIGFPHFHEMCRLCHGAPGCSREEFAEGLYPDPPELTSDEIQKELNDAEIYWVVKNGLKMTGMPSFGATHSEEALQGIVAFMRRLPNITPEEYAAMVKAGVEHEEEKSL